MTTEDFNEIKWRLVGHLSMTRTHYSTYVGKWDGIIITMQTANRVLKCGGYGKTRIAYWVGLRKFKSKEELIKYINELDGKEIRNEND